VTLYMEGGALKHLVVLVWCNAQQRFFPCNLLQIFQSVQYATELKGQRKKGFGRGRGSTASFVLFLKVGTCYGL